jgi:hypothetical protein
MNYFGINYCPRKVFHKWKDWAFWTVSNTPTYIGDIESRFFLRIFGVEFKIMYWKSQDERRGIFFQDKYELTLGYDTEKERDDAVSQIKGCKAMAFSPGLKCKNA